jgi:drug/metabolite transporter (DMT)-like permease
VRTSHWLFIVGMALFVAGIAFVVAGARAERFSKTAPTTTLSLVPVASVKQIMNGIVAPAATSVFDAVSTVVTAEGIKEKVPATDAEWEALGNSAAALVEAGNLMLIGQRAVDHGEWVTMSKALIDAGTRTLRAVEEKNSQKVFELGETLYEACDNCHRKYQRTF